MTFEITELHKLYLQQHGWLVKDTPYGYMIKNENTGCKISGQFVNQFVQELIKELIEEDNAQSNPLPSTEQILQMNGYTMICESPLEIQSPEQNMITGQCALWLVQTLKEKMSSIQLMMVHLDENM